MKRTDGSGLSEAHLHAARRSLRGFLPECRIQYEQGGVGPFRSGPTQEPVLKELTRGECGGPGDWLIVNKPRQSWMSTLCAAWLLRDTLYTPGANGLLICNKNETNSELWSRIRTMYDYLPDTIKIPAGKAGAKEYEFAHRGRLKCTTAMGDDPALGFSIDRMQCSEFGFWSGAGTVWGKLAPALIKRRHARVVIESTPGAQGCLFQSLFFSALEGKSRFKPIFIRWWDYAGYTAPVPDGFQPDQSELALLTQFPGMTYGHLMFRRNALTTIYAGDTRLFEHCYPYTPYDGWMSGNTPAMPEGPLKALLHGAVQDTRELGEPWEPIGYGEKYMIVVDPNGYGNIGDPSAVTIWNLHRRTEVSAWSARMDPVALGEKLAVIGSRYNNALIVVESNSAACYTALTRTGYSNVWSAGKKEHPGYYRTAVNKERSQVSLVEQLNAGQLRIRSRAGLQQLLAWDGSSERVVADGHKHHWDRVVTYQIVADMMRKLRIPDGDSLQVLSSPWGPAYEPDTRSRLDRLADEGPIS